MSKGVRGAVPLSGGNMTGVSIGEGCWAQGVGGSLSSLKRNGGAVWESVVVARYLRWGERNRGSQLVGGVSPRPKGGLLLYAIERDTFNFSK